VNGFRKKKLLKADRRRRLTASASLLVLATVFVLTGAAAADDQQKAEKELRRVTSMAMDPAARPLVSETVAEFLKVPRAEVVKVRRATNLSYGSIFLAYRLASGEAALEKTLRNCMRARRSGKSATRNMLTGGESRAIRRS